LGGTGDVKTVGKKSRKIETKHQGKGTTKPANVGGVGLQFWVGTRASA